MVGQWRRKNFLALSQWRQKNFFPAKRIVGIEITAVMLTIYVVSAHQCSLHHIRHSQIIEKMNFGSYTKLSPTCGKVVTFNANKEARNDIGSCKIMGQNSGTAFIK
jgi:hypothetical protein